jgi:SAM-dependent methyltransferase
MSLDRETGRDRYFEARDRELAAFVDPRTGRLAREHARHIDCPLCGSSQHRALFEKQGFTFVRCEDCRLVFVNPQLKEDVALDGYRTAETSDLWVEVLTSERQLDLDREKFGEVIDALEPYRGRSRLLDVGCSIGLFLDLARERGWHGVGIELAPRARSLARERGLQVLDVPFAEAGFAPESFDAVALLSVLEHTTDPRRMLVECGRVLGPGGALYVIVPNVESLACRVLRERARTFDGRNHLVYFSRSTLTDLLDRMGFETAHMTTRVSSLVPVLTHLAYEEPYGEARTDDDRLTRWVAEHGSQVEGVLAELDLGYKLHCLATKRDRAS